MNELSDEQILKCEIDAMAQRRRGDHLSVLFARAVIAAHEAAQPDKDAEIERLSWHRQDLEQKLIAKDAPAVHPFSMTLRNYFAAKAMQAIIPEDRDYPDMARISYEMADAMLKEVHP
jgi:hypothetical protein